MRMARIAISSAAGLRRDCAVSVGSHRARVEGHGARHGGDPGPLPGAEDQPEVQRGSHEVQPQPAEDLVDAAEGLQRAGEHGPQRAAGHAGEDGDAR